MNIGRINSAAKLDVHRYKYLCILIYKKKRMENNQGDFAEEKNQSTHYRQTTFSKKR